MVSTRRSARTAAVALVVAALVGCGASGGSDGADEPTSTTGSTTTTTEATTSSGSSTTTVPATTTTEPPGLEGASTSQHSAPPEGDGVALLRDVRIGSHDGYERVVFEFAGTDQPGYTVEWVDGPVYSDGPGEVVEVAGDARLVVRMEPASGVDLSTPEAAVVYDGPDRIPAGGRTDVIAEVVRTGDFEAVLTWVVGAAEAVPFRVTRLADPARLVIDLEAS